MDLFTLPPRLTHPVWAAAPTNTTTPPSSHPAGLTPVTGANGPKNAAPPSGGASQADTTSHLTTAPSGAPEALTPLSTLKPVSSQESKALGSTATTMVVSTLPAGDSSISQHCE